MHICKYMHAFVHIQIYTCIYIFVSWLGGDLWLGGHLQINIFFQNCLILHFCKDVSNKLKLSSSVVTEAYWNLIDLKEDNGGTWQQKKMWHDSNCKLFQPFCVNVWFISTSSLLFFSRNICTSFLPESCVLRFCLGTLHFPFSWRKEAVLEFLDCLWWYTIYASSF